MSAAKRSFLFLLLFAVMPFGSGLAEPAERTPARFVDGKRSLQSLIEVPAVENETMAAVYCVVSVLPGGDMRDNHCFADTGVDERFREAIRSAIKKTKFVPAIVDGQARTARIYYRVVFLAKPDRASVVGVYPNWGDDIERYDSSYEAPQRIMQHGPVAQCAFFTSELYLLARLPIAADGRVAGDVSFSGDYGKQHRLCISSLKHELEESEFIPAHNNGSPVDAIYVEPIGRYSYMKVE